MNKKWLKCAGVRALKTVAQTAIATIGTSALMQDVNWLMVLSASVLAGVLSLLTSVAGLPEVWNVADAIPLEEGSIKLKADNINLEGLTEVNTYDAEQQKEGV